MGRVGGNVIDDAAIRLKGDVRRPCRAPEIEDRRSVEPEGWGVAVLRTANGRDFVKDPTDEECVFLRQRDVTPSPMERVEEDGAGRRPERRDQDEALGSAALMNTRSLPSAAIYRN